jgi:hypothetical protein
MSLEKVVAEFDNVGRQHDPPLHEIEAIKEGNIA